MTDPTRYLYDGGRGRPASETRDRTDEPSPAIVASPDSSRQYAIERTRVVHDTGRDGDKGSRSQGDVSDRPAPTVLAGDRRSRELHVVRERVVHETPPSGRGDTGRGDVSDRPAPTVLARWQQGNELHVERATIVQPPTTTEERSGSGGYSRERRTDAGQPAPAVTTRGFGGRLAYWLERESTPATPETIASDCAAVWTQEGAARVSIDTTLHKPPYRVPTMDEVRAVPWNGRNVVSTFAASGGSSTGYRMAGYRVLAAVEWDKDAQDSYAANMAERTHLFRDDVRNVTPEMILQATGLKAGELDLLDGSPPCQPFSSAGKRDASWGDGRDDLFFDFAKLVEQLRPKVFVAENVAGLVRGRAKGYFKLIHKRLTEAGYHVEARLLDAQWLGVPQTRQRLIFVGVRDDLAGRLPTVNGKPAIPFPKPLGYRYSVRDALPWIFRHGSAPPYKDWHAVGRDPFRTLVDSATEPSGCVTTQSYHEGIGAVEALPGSGDAARDRLPDDAGTAERFRHVTQGAKAGENGERDRADEPAPTIVATPNAACQYALERDAQPDESTRVVHDPGAHSGSMRRPQGDVTDRPAATIGAEGGGPQADHQVERTRVVHDLDHGQHASQGDVTDRPAPTIQARHQSHHELHVERETATSEEVRAYAGSFEQFHTPRDVTEEPVPAILAGQQWHQGVEREGGPRTRQDPDEEKWRVVRTDGDVVVERRKFTIPELKAICSFPPDYVLTGSYSAQWHRLGDAVPPLMMRAIAECVRDEILPLIDPCDDA